MKFDSKELRLLDLNSSAFVPKSISDLLAEVSMIHDIPLKLSKLNDYVCVLEQEMKKIDGFRRELPLCMLLLNDAIWKLKEEVVKLKKREVETVVMEEFMPLKGNSDREDERPKRKSADWTDKKTWMSSAQLWTAPIQYENGFNTVKIQDTLFLHQARHQERSDGAARWSLCDQTQGFNKKLGGAFLPFTKPCDAVVTKTEEEEEEEEEDPINGLSLSMPALAEVGSVDHTNSKGKHVGVASDDGTGVLSEGGSSSQTTQGKKQRRCWSHDLHQSFVKALFELGGAQAATPKQIRETMQVDGLTNDEVKSHLQKYRLHIRKLMPSSSSASQDYEWLRRGELSYLRNPSAKQSASPEGPLHLVGSAKGASVTGGESMEEEEDRRSESCGWKDRHQKPTD